MLDHVHMLIAIPPKYAVSQVVVYMKGKSAIHVARAYLGRERNFAGQHFWARGLRILGTVTNCSFASERKRLLGHEIDIG